MHALGQANNFACETRVQGKVPSRGPRRTSLLKIGEQFILDLCEIQQYSAGLNGI